MKHEWFTLRICKITNKILLDGFNISVIIKQAHLLAAADINPLPPEPLPTWDTEAFFGIFEGFRRNFTTIFWVVLCPKHLLVIEGNYQTFQKHFFLHDLVT
jgi:hypothetical protein